MYVLEVLCEYVPDNTVSWISSVRVKQRETTLSLIQRADYSVGESCWKQSTAVDLRDIPGTKMWLWVVTNGTHTLVFDDDFRVRGQSAGTSWGVGRTCGRRRRSSASLSCALWCCLLHLVRFTFVNWSSFQLFTHIHITLSTCIHLYLLT